MNETTGYNGWGESLIPDPVAGTRQAAAGWSQAMDSSAGAGSRAFGAFEGVAYSLDTAVGLIPGEGAAEHAVEKEVEHVIEGEAKHATETTVTKDAKNVANDTGAAGSSGGQVTKPDVKPTDTGNPHAPGDVPNQYPVVKGGTTAPPAPGTEFSASAGHDVTDAGKGVPHKQIQETTAGDIRGSGGKVDVAPEPTRAGDINYRHVNVTEGGSKTTFSAPKPNPANPPKPPPQ